MVTDLYIIRFAVCAKHATDDDMHVAVRIIREHAERVIAEHRAQRNGRQSSSTDSLELVTKEIPLVDLEEDTAVSEETADPEALPETPVGPNMYPKIKTRVSEPGMLQQLMQCLLQANTITMMTPHHRVTFDKTPSNLAKDKRARPMFVRMVSDAKLYNPKQTLSQISRQTSLVPTRTRKRMQSDSGNNATRSSSERYLSRTVSILETVNSDEGEIDDKQ